MGSGASVVCFRVDTTLLRCENLLINLGYASFLITTAASHIATCEALIYVNHFFFQIETSRALNNVISNFTVV